jgi:hypothetical protein
VILLEAVKQTFAVKPKGLRAPARVFVPGALKPAGAPALARDLAGELAADGPSEGLGRPRQSP